MDRLMEHREIQELLGAYALDAVPPDEAEEIERHLVGCRQCQAEVASYREVAALIGSSDTPAPPAVWDRIAASLEAEPPPLQLDRFQPPAQPAAPVPISSGRKTVSARVLAAVVAVAAVVVIGLGIQVIRLNTRTNRLPGAVASQLLANSYRAAANEFDARHVAMNRTDGSRPVPVVILPNGTTFVDARQLPTLPADRTYQLWGLSDTTSAPVSLAVMGNDPSIQQLTTPSEVRGLALTQERAGGAPAPTTPILAQAQIPA